MKFENILKFLKVLSLKVQVLIFSYLTPSTDLLFVGQASSVLDTRTENNPSKEKGSILIFITQVSSGDTYASLNFLDNENTLKEVTKKIKLTKVINRLNDTRRVSSLEYFARKELMELTSKSN